MSTSVTEALVDPGEGLCHREELERIFVHNNVDFAADRDIWREMIALARTGDYADVVQRRGGVDLAEPPEGTSWARWAEWVDLRLSELAEAPDSVFRNLPEHPGPWQVRSGTIDHLQRDVVRRHLASMSLPTVEGRRDYVLVDVTEPIGTATRLDRETGEVAEFPTSRIGVVLERTDRLRVLGLHAADPAEHPRADEWRHRWPVLASALGGWFSEAAFEDYSPWMVQRRMLTLETDERLERLADAGRELLQLGDDDLHAAVTALGCYVEPSYLRLWLEWMFWRIGYFDWK